MTEVSCHNCRGACCKGNPLLVMQLSTAELELMKSNGNNFMTVAEPVDYDREKVIYPAGIQINAKRRTFNWLAERDREYEPLPAGLGRYALVGECKNLATDENGWEYCSIYNERPSVCRDFEEGGQKCRLLRMLSGVDIPLAPDVDN